MNKYRSRKHTILLYPDCSEHCAAFEKLINIEHVGILHDKDKNEKGEIKKPHWHIVLCYKAAVWNTAISKELGIPLNYIQQVRSEDAILEYLIHKNEENKHQYSLEEIFGSKKLVKKVKELAEKGDVTESEKVIELIELIENCDRPITIGGFSRVCASMGRWDVFRRSASIFLKIIEEKNKSLQN